MGGCGTTYILNDSIDYKNTYKGVDELCQV